MTDVVERKVFVIDTNVLIHNPESILSFRENEIVIPLQVLEELDRLKTYPDQRGKSARDAIRFLDSLAKKGDLNEGVKLENGSILRVSLAQANSAPKGFDLEKNDNRIILCAVALKEGGRQVFFVSKDINARVKSTALEVKAVDYEKEKVDIATLYQGVVEVDVAPDVFAAFEATGVLPWKDQLKVNQYVILHKRGGTEEQVGRWNPEDGTIESLPDEPGSVSGVLPLNSRQRVALALLLDDRLQLVTIVGKAGTGKTLMAIAAGLRKIYDEKIYAKMLITRPVVPVGKDIGYLPGEKQAKMSNWMQPVFDNIEYILGVHKREKAKTVDQMIKDKQIEIEALSYIRGRSLPNQYIVIDEAQNLTPHEIKTIVSRAGEGSKVVLTGDPYQIDNMYLDANSNGLCFLVDAFKGQAIYGHVTLQKTERSELAELASTLL
ncbi:MAG: phosphate starvation-inducible protein PhoH [Spirochaetae bacterium HGW-Spirochaetae-7]|jgi:PhoH-like ATPase|nr:MAG: phosphate starvation-inducible protein PhoH [Spirochaetae bacterium HGW-Spirochaetae-7]